MLAWSGGTDNGRQKTRNHGYDVIVGGELFTDYSDHPRKLVTLNPKLKSTGARALPALSRWWDALPQAAWPERLLSEKSGRCGIAARVRRGALPMIEVVVISVRPSTVAAISGLHCRALVMVSSSIRLTAWLQNSKPRRSDWSWCMSRVAAIISALVIYIIVTLSWAVNHY